jgi:hypothetical protein
MMRPGRGAPLAAMAVLVAIAAPVSAHSGPPYPAISSQRVGGYLVAVWTDPDTTDDGSAQGKFWITLRAAAAAPPVAAGTHVEVSIKPSDRAGALVSARAEPVANDPSTFFAALRMDHEGPYAVHVSIAGAGGRGELDCQVDATYDLRPARWLLALYLMPFLLVALLWGKLIVARRRRARAA